jgi:hypothetical protein
MRAYFKTSQTNLQVTGSSSSRVADPLDAAAA